MPCPRERCTTRNLVDVLTVDQLPTIAALDRLGPVLGAPGSTGDERWDALLAGSVRPHLRLLGLPAPAWTLRGPLDAWWWPAGHAARAGPTA